MHSLPPHVVAELDTDTLFELTENCLLILQYYYALYWTDRHSGTVSVCPSTVRLSVETVLNPINKEIHI